MKSKKINELTMLEAVSNAANVLVEENGEATRIPAKKMVVDSLPEALRFGEKTVVLGDTLTWDGNTEGLANAAGVFFKISDSVPTLNDFANGCTVGLFAEGNAFEQEVPPGEGITDLADGVHMIAEAVVVVEDIGVGVDIDGLAFPETGLYMFNQFGMAYAYSITIPGYTFTKTEIKTIETKYLPEYLQFGGTVEEVGDTLTWDGNTTGLTKVHAGDGFDLYKISDAVPPPEALANGCTITMQLADGTEDLIEAEAFATTNIDGVYVANEVIFVVYERGVGASIGGVSFPEAGAYFYAGSNYVSSVTTPGYTWTAGTIKPIDDAYLPERLKFGDFPNGSDTLTWDGNTEGLVEFDGCYKVSDVTFSFSDVQVGFVIKAGNEKYFETISIPATDEFIAQGDAVICRYNGQAWAVSVGPVMAPLIGTAPGTYLPTFAEEGETMFVSALTIPGFSGFPVFKPLDKKYLPGDLIPAYTAADEGKVLKIVNGVPTWVAP